MLNYRPVRYVLIRNETWRQGICLIVVSTEPDLTKPQTSRQATRMYDANRRLARGIHDLDSVWSMPACGPFINRASPGGLVDCWPQLRLLGPRDRNH